MVAILTTFKSQFQAINLKKQNARTNEIVKVMMAYLDEEKFLNNHEFYEQLDEQRAKAAKHGLPFSVINKISPDFIEDENIDLMSINHKLYLRSEFFKRTWRPRLHRLVQGTHHVPYANDLMFTLRAKTRAKRSRS